MPSPSPSSEYPPELRPGLRAGEREALAALFDLYFDRVYNYVRRLVREEHLAEDLTQDTFLRVQRFRHTYDPGRDPRAWLFAIATNTVRGAWRSRRRREVAEGLPLDLGELDPPASGAQSPAGLLSESDLFDHMRSIVEDLPRGMRMTVLLRAYEGLSFEAVAGILELTPEAARKRYSRALALLRERLGQRADDPAPARRGS